MNRKWLYLAMSGALALSVQAVSAQEPPPGPPPGAEFGEHGGPGPIGPRMEILGFGEMHPGKVVTGAPFSAVAVTETKQTLADGNTIDRKVQSNIYRDSQGRTRRETTFTGPLAAGSASGTTHTAVMIHDPVANTAYVLHAENKTAEQLPTHPGRGPNRADANGELQNRFEQHIQEEIANGTLKKEDLGTQTIGGVTATGTRYTHIIPAGKIGNASAINVVNEQWYSSDLQMVVKSTRTDPRQGTVTYTVTSLQRTEPASSLFAVPSDYSVKQAVRGGRRGPGGPGAPPAPPADAPATSDQQ
jgi:hypothetical protein